MAERSRAGETRPVMRREAEIREYRDALHCSLQQPCGCQLDRRPHTSTCIMNRALMRDAIRTLDWVLGLSGELKGHVKYYVDELHRIRESANFYDRRREASSAEAGVQNSAPARRRRRPTATRS